MAFVEMGPVTNSLIRMVTKRFKGEKTEPLFARTKPTLAAEGPVDTAPIKTAPLNQSEKAEQDTLRSIRDALRDQPRD